MGLCACSRLDCSRGVLPAAVAQSALLVGLAVICQRALIGKGGINAFIFATPTHVRRMRLPVPLCPRSEAIVGISDAFGDLAPGISWIYPDYCFHRTC